MSRLQRLKQRAGRSEIGVVKLSSGWFVATGKGQGDYSGPHTRREAIHEAARWAHPRKAVNLVVTLG